MFDEFSPQIDGSLRDICTMGVGGEADFIIRVRTRAGLVSLFRQCRELGVRLVPIGHGTNVFFTDGRVKGVVAVVSFAGIEMREDGVLAAAAGTSLSDLLEFSFRRSLAGLELFSGIPGTVGGAVSGNAGAYGADIGSRLVRAEVLDESGNTRIVGNDFFDFRYRDSVLKRRSAILLEAEFRLEEGCEADLRKRSEEILELRRRKLPSPGIRTSGSYFKNICLPSGDREAAASYLDRIGSRECSVGDAVVFEGHANIICNRANCRARDILRLERILADRVRERFGISLDREVVYIE